MEQYKVKAKHKQSGMWLFGVPLTIEGKDMLLLEDTENGLRVHYVEDEMWLGEVYAVEIDKETICRPTGLTDKNGNKIWENDIVYIPYAHLEDTYCKVIFTFGTFIGELSDGTHDSILSRNAEVIGNIFDNPELLEVLS